MTFQLNPGQQRAQDNLYATDKRFCLLYGGSRSGKTFLAIRSILVRALKAPKSKHLVVRQEASAARASIMRGSTATLPVVQQTCFPKLVYEPNEQYGYISLPNGSEIWIGGLNDDKAMERILGNEYATIYMNEASECRYSAFTLLRSRLAQVVYTDVEDLPSEPLRQKFFVDLNPTTRAHWTYRLWIDGIDPETDLPVDLASYGAEVINPLDNQANLSGDYLADLHALPERARRRFLEGKYTEDAENALWRRSFFKRVQKLPEFTRIVVAIDPATTTNVGSDLTGIVACGIDASGNGYTLEDASGKYKPEEWARQAVSLFRIWGADRVIGETNQGGDMVEAVLRAHAPDIPYRAVVATRGKVVRAEPVAALYERGKVFHYAGSDFTALEDELCTVTVGFDRTAAGFSPDRMDALVWAYTDLFPQMTRERVSSGPIKRSVGTLA